MDSEAVARLAGAARVPHGSSDDPDLLDFSANTNPVIPEGVENVYRDAVGASSLLPCVTGATLSMDSGSTADHLPALTSDHG